MTIRLRQDHGERYDLADGPVIIPNRNQLSSQYGIAYAKGHSAIANDIGKWRGSICRDFLSC